MNPKEIQGIYRFWSNPRVKAEQILASHRDGVLSRLKHCRTVLAIQDTTDLSFASSRNMTGVGFIAQSKNKGLKVYLYRSFFHFRMASVTT